MKELDVDEVIAALDTATPNADDRYNSYYDGWDDAMAVAAEIIRAHRRTMIAGYTPEGSRRPINVGDTVDGQRAPGKRKFPARILKIIAIGGEPVELHCANLAKGGASLVLTPDQIKPQPKKRGAA